MEILVQFGVVALQYEFREGEMCPWAVVVVFSFILVFGLVLWGTALLSAKAGLGAPFWEGDTWDARKTIISVAAGLLVATLFVVFASNFWNLNCEGYSLWR